MKGVAVILAGGKSSRMGRDKSLLDLNGKPFIAHVREAMEGLNLKVVISSSNSGHTNYGELVPDEQAGLGPLIGLESVFNKVKADYYLVVSCDTPFISASLLMKLEERLKQRSCSVICTTESKDYPLVACYKASDLALIKNQITQNKLAVMKWLNLFPCEKMEVNKKEVLNVNTKEDYLNLGL